MGADIAVRSVTLFNRDGHESKRLNDAKVSLIDSASRIIETVDIGKADGRSEIEIQFGLSDTDVVAWKSPSSTGEPLLSDGCKTQLAAKFRRDMDSFDTSIALVFGNKTTIGQVCSFAKGLTSTIVSSIPGFCCLDAPYQSKAEEWGEKVRSWWGGVRRVVRCLFSSELTTCRVYHLSSLAKSTQDYLTGVQV